MALHANVRLHEVRMAETLTPGPDQARAFRTALGRYATGVTVVTAQAASGPVGMTANSFTAVSLDPPLVLWCPARRSARFAALTGAAHFAIHVLAHDQLDLGLHFARTGDDFSPFATERTPEGAPALGGVLARFDCTAHAHHEGGDHAILVGRVIRATFRDGAPLLFWGGLYGDFLRHD
jgi:flavin reductase (DIM6/NTAB) family NADH-FMN oxidoreductase RutF